MVPARAGTSRGGPGGVPRPGRSGLAVRPRRLIGRSGPSGPLHPSLRSIAVPRVAGFLSFLAGTSKSEQVPRGFSSRDGPESAVKLARTTFRPGAAFRTAEALSRTAGGQSRTRNSRSRTRLLLSRTRSRVPGHASGRPYSKFGENLELAVPAGRYECNDRLQVKDFPCKFGLRRARGGGAIGSGLNLQGITDGKRESG